MANIILEQNIKNLKWFIDDTNRRFQASNLVIAEMLELYDKQAKAEKLLIKLEALSKNNLPKERKPHGKGSKK